MAGSGWQTGSAGAASAAQAFEELERLVHALGEELAFFRRRALEAERRVKELAHPEAGGGGRAEPAGLPAGAPGAGDAAGLATRVASLEAENADLRARLGEAAERTRAMAERLRFARQQEEVDGER